MSIRNMRYISQMLKKGMSYPFLIFTIAAIIGGYYLYLHPPTPGGGASADNTTQLPYNQTGNQTGFVVCSFNVQTFGLSTMSCPACVKELVAALTTCDIAVIQEIRDISDTAFPDLCKKLPAYKCIAGERKGRSTSKEQYGLLYKSALVTNVPKVTESEDYDKWERPPTTFTLSVNGVSYDIVALHSKPDDTPAELDYLDDYAATFSDHTIALGDFNMDGDYYSGTPIVFANWTKVIPDGCDSTVATSQNCYDRIFLNWKTAYTYGIYDNITSAMSDHKLVWVSLN